MMAVVTTGATRRAKLQSNHHQQQTDTQFIHAGCPSCHPTNSVKALKDCKLKFKDLFKYFQEPSILKLNTFKDREF